MSSKRKTPAELAQAVFDHPNRKRITKLARYDSAKALEKRGRTNLIHDLLLLDSAVDIRRSSQDTVIDLGVGELVPA